MNRSRIEKKLKKIILDKYLFYGATLLCTYFMIDLYFNWETKFFNVVIFLALLIFNLLSMAVWNTADRFYEQVFAYYKIGLSVKFLKELSKNHFDLEQYVQIIYQANQKLNFKLVPILRSSDGRYLSTLSMLVELHYLNSRSSAKEKIIDDSLIEGQDFLSSEERAALVETSKIFIN